MTCSEAELLISLYIDNLLPDGSTAQLLEHFEQCPKCRQGYKDYLAVKSLLAAELNADVSPDFENKVMKKIKSSIKTRDAFVIYPKFKKKIIAAAAGFLFIALSSAALFTAGIFKKKSSYDLSWYYDTYQESTYETYYEDSIESFLLSI